MSALYDTNAAVLKTAAFNSIGVGSLPYLVGYRQKANFVKGSSLFCPSFVAVSGGAAKLSNWKPTNADAYVYGEISFESLDEFGRSVPNSTFCYADPTYSFSPENLEWCDGNWMPAEKVFGPGEAVWFNMPGDDQTTVSPVGITDAGAVNEEDLTVTLHKGSNAVGNFMAVDYPISDIEILNDEGAYVYGEISFESLDEFGRSVPNSTFCYADPTYSFSPENLQWCDGNWIPVADTDVLNPSQGVWFNSPMESENEGDGLKIKFYAPDL